MPAYKVPSTFNREARAAGGVQNYGYLIDQLAIKENLLSQDGKLSPGDYDVLMRDAQKLMTNPMLSAGERSNVQVKISGYQEKKKTDKLKDNQDLKKIDSEISNDMKKASLSFGNDPAIYLKAKAANLEGKIFRLRENIDQIQRAGGDASQQEMALLQTNDEWIDTTDAMTAAESWKPGQPPLQGFVANVSTNNRGEIRDISISRTPESKHLMTNAVLGGFQVAGMPNAQIGTQEGKNVFKLGNKTFSASTNLRPGPDGTMKQDTLIDESQQQAVGTRGRTRATSEYTEVLSTDVKTQRYTTPGDWIQGEGAFYKQLDDGTYEKYINATKEDLQIDESSLMKNLPRELLDGVIKKTIRTNDAAMMRPQAPASSTPGFTPPAGGIPGPTTMPPTTIPGPTAPTSTPAGQSRTPAPTSRAPSSAAGVAGGAMSKAKSFLGSLFGGS